VNATRDAEPRDIREMANQLLVWDPRSVVGRRWIALLDAAEAGDKRALAVVEKELDCKYVDDDPDVSPRWRHFWYHEGTGPSADYSFAGKWRLDYPEGWRTS
jgi:hypothetical protein